MSIPVSVSVRCIFLSVSHDLNFHIFINLLRIPQLRSVESRESPFCVPGVACLYPLPLSFLSFNKALLTLLLLLQYLRWFCWCSVCGCFYLSSLLCYCFSSDFIFCFLPFWHERLAHCFSFFLIFAPTCPTEHGLLFFFFHWFPDRGLKLYFLISKHEGFSIYLV